MVWVCEYIFFFFHGFLSFWIMSGSERPEDVALGHHVHGWATERHVYARTQNTHIHRERKALQDKILYLYSPWPSVPWCPSVCVCLFDCFSVSLLIASDIYVRGVFKVLMLITCYLPRMSAVITLTQRYWHACHGHSLIPLGPISSQSSKSPSDWLLGLMLNVRGC